MCTAYTSLPMSSAATSATFTKLVASSLSFMTSTVYSFTRIFNGDASSGMTGLTVYANKGTHTYAQGEGVTKIAPADPCCLRQHSHSKKRLSVPLTIV